MLKTLSIFSDSTVTSPGSTVVRGFTASDLTLIVNITATPTGTTPTISFSVQQVDPANESTVIGSAVSTGILNSIGLTAIHLSMADSVTALVTWAVGGSSPSFSGLYVSAIQKDSITSLPTGTNTIGKIEQGAGSGAAGTHWYARITDGTNTMPTGDGISRSVFNQISDGTVGPVTVKPSSTPAVVGDLPLVVTMHPSSAALQVSTAPPSTQPGFSFGDISTAATAIVAVRRTTYTEPTSGAQRSIGSSNANDSSAGTGARTVRITYYTLNAGVVSGPFTETIIMNGTTAVNTTATDICYVESMEVLTVGSTGSNVGIITLFNSTAGSGGTLGTIAATDNRTFWNHHYVSTSKTCNLTAIWAGHSGTTVGSGATFFVRTKDLSSSAAADRQITDSFRLYGQSSSQQRNYGSPIKVMGPARLQMYVTPETSTSVNYRGSFDFYDE